MRKALVCTGWCAHHEGHNNPMRSKAQNESLYLGGVWLPSITRQINPGGVHVYVSGCDIPPAMGNLAQVGANVVWSGREAKALPYRHDWAASIMVGGAYALANDMDLLYIEQDCLVYGLDQVLRLAGIKDNAIYYGFGDNASYSPGWAENCLTFVSNKLLAMLIWAMGEIKNCTDGETKFEQAFHSVIMGSELEQYFQAWPFGVGRLRPIPFESEGPFYAQQLTDQELDMFIDKLEQRYPIDERV